ncbi:MAG: D-alanyl-D-alanine carboxypeptidase [Lachnospiraceae bacterium]|nr:D-alanyl-D-alanine carboxypeptidase [Lachnospiraceae bacterium]
MWKKIMALLAAVSIFMSMSGWCEGAYVYADEIMLYAKSAVLMDADSGRVLYERNGYEQMAMASTTKIMTLIVTLENANLDDTVEVSAYAASMPDVQLNIREGENYRLGDLVYSLMLESHNDSAVAIAEHVGGSVEGFAALMNRKAEEIGCENTYYITPNGLDATDGDKFHSTTARDLALVMSYCIKKSPQKEKFLEITRTPSHSFSDTSGQRSFSCTNHNAFLGMMTGALSGKTGFTNKAGYCYVGALERDGKTFVVALLACGWPNHKTYKWSDTRALMEFGLANYQYRSFDEAVIPESAFAEIQVTGAKSGQIGGIETIQVEAAETQDTFYGVEGLLMNGEEKITVTLHKVKGLSAPVSKGQNVGHISYKVGDEEWKRVELVAAEGKEAVDFVWCLKMVFEKWSI